jgi:ABC-type transport system involved in multi-copper enzyme maturation permease subunit
MIKILAAAGIVLLLSGPLMIGWIYAVNPPDFSYNIAVPLFDGIVIGLASLGIVSLVLSRVSISPRRATAVGVAFMLVPVAIFFIGNMTTETACFGPCGNAAPLAQIQTCSASGASVICNVSVSNFGAANTVSATSCSIQVQKNEIPWGTNSTGTAGTLGGNRTFPVDGSGLLTCAIQAPQPPTGYFVYMILRFSSNVTIGFGPYVWT